MLLARCLSKYSDLISNITMSFFCEYLILGGNILLLDLFLKVVNVEKNIQTIHCCQCLTLLRWERNHQSQISFFFLLLFISVVILLWISFQKKDLYNISRETLRLNLSKWDFDKVKESNFWQEYYTTVIQMQVRKPAKKTFNFSSWSTDIYLHSFFQMQRDSLYHCLSSSTNLLLRKEIHSTNVWVPQIMEEQKLFKIFLKILQVFKNFCKWKGIPSEMKLREWGYKPKTR